MTEGIVDLTRIQETSDGDLEFESELIDMYFQDAEELLTAIREAAAEGDMNALKTAAHTLKGASANIGAVGIQQDSLALETAAAAGEDVNPLVARLDSRYAATESFLKKYLEEIR